MERTVHVRVPGTSANCGPGFDSLGLACDVYNDLEMTLLEEPGVTIEISGEGADAIPKDETNLCWRSAVHLLKAAGLDGKYVGARMKMENHVPLERGLGSSAAAIVAGLKAANVLIGGRFSKKELLVMATEIEGHPDNVSPAIYGGFSINTVSEGHVDCFNFMPRLDLDFIVAVPSFTLSTKASREVLPKTITRADAIYNISRAAMLIAGLLEGSREALRLALDDALHQPFRAYLIPGMYDVFEAANRAGAIGATLSGAGPCLMAYAMGSDGKSQEIGRAMQRAFAEYGVESEIMILNLDRKGARVVEE